MKVPIKKVHICRAGYAEPYNHMLLDSTMYEKDISNVELERRVGCSEGLVGKWRSGRVSPSEHYRILICEALEVPQGYFNGRRRRRRIQK